MIDNFVADSSDKNVSIFLIFLILYKNSDENHPLTINAINEILESKYQGIHLDRKTLGKKLNTLMSVLNDEEDFPFSIAKIPNKGWCINERPFVDEQIIFLMDSIYSNKSISFAEANDLCDSINRCLSKYQVKEKYCDYKSSDVNNGNSEGVLYNIAIIREAIKLKKNISFKKIRYERWIKRPFISETVVTPFYLVNKGGVYYLLASRLLPSSLKREHPVCVSRAFKVEKLNDLKFDNETKPIDIEWTVFGGDFSLNNFMNSNLTIDEGIITNKTCDGVSATFKGSLSYFNHNSDFLNKYMKYKDSNFKIIKKNIHSDLVYFTIVANESFLIDFAVEYADEFELIEPETLRKKVVMKLYDYITGQYDIVNNIELIQKEEEKEIINSFIDKINELYYLLFTKKCKYDQSNDYSFLDIIRIIVRLYNLISKGDNNRCYHRLAMDIENIFARYLYFIEKKKKILFEKDKAYSFLCCYILADFCYPILKNSFSILNEITSKEQSLYYLDTATDYYNDKTYELLKDELELLHIDKQDLNPEAVIKKITANIK